MEGAPDGRMPFSFLCCKGVRGTASLAIHYENMVEPISKLESEFLSIFFLFLFCEPELCCFSLKSAGLQGRNDSSEEMGIPHLHPSRFERIRIPSVPNTPATSASAVS